MKSNAKKIILDLCGGTGSWAKPYKDAGYDVRTITLPDNDVRTFVPPPNVYGILAAPPCTMFSLARTKAKIPRDLAQGMETVEACLRIIWTARKQGKLAFWALENPMGYLRQFLGNPVYTFDPSQFHEKYNKTTDLWGYFKPPKKSKKARYSSTGDNTRELPDIPEEYRKDFHMSNLQILRSITPAGFAKAFFEANK